MTEKLAGGEWEQHGSVWLLIGKARIPKAIILPIVSRKEETVDEDERRIAATARCIGD